MPKQPPPPRPAPDSLGSPEGALRGPVSLRVPEGDDRLRKVCDDCGFVFYENPKVIVGAVCTWEAAGEEPRFLMVRRGIEPRLGYWGLPSGYMEMHETSDAGAAREVWEEARAKVTTDRLLAIYNLPHISQVHLIYRARMADAHHGAGPESIETGLFTWDEIPWDDLAYPNVAWALETWQACDGRSDFAPATGPINLADALSSANVSHRRP